MKKEDFMVQLHRMEAKTKLELLEFLQHHPMMRTWQESLINKLIHAVPKKKYKRGQYVITEG